MSFLNKCQSFVKNSLNAIRKWMETSITIKKKNLFYTVGHITIIIGLIIFLKHDFPPIAENLSAIIHNPNTLDESKNLLTKIYEYFTNKLKLNNQPPKGRRLPEITPDESKNLLTKIYEYLKDKFKLDNDKGQLPNITPDKPKNLLTKIYEYLKDKLKLDNDKGPRYDDQAKKNKENPKGEGHAQRQSALMYMLARHVLLHAWWIGDDILTRVASCYHTYYHQLVEGQRAIPKTLFIDEYHRTGGLPSFRQLVVQDALEGRKWNIKLILASQELTHFDDEIIQQATALWLLGGVKGSSYIETVNRKLGLSASALHILTHELTGPSAQGTPLLLRLTTKTGEETHFLRCILSPLELWALSTTPEDVVLRQNLSQKLGHAKARRRLAKFYPQGTIKHELERRRQQLTQNRKSDHNSSHSFLADIQIELLGYEGD